MSSRCRLLLLALVVLASCRGGRAAAPPREADGPEATGSFERAIEAAGVGEFERAIEARLDTADFDDSVAHASLLAEARSAALDIVQEPGGRPGGPERLRQDRLPRIADSALIAGVMRWDGMVVPFAAFDRGRWLPVRRGAFGQRVARAPVPSWYFFALHGPERAVWAGAIVSAGGRCQRFESWGQVTGLDPGALPWPELFDSEQERERADAICPVSRIGLALSEDLPLVAMVDVPAGDPVKSAMLERVRAVFDGQETEELERLRLQPDTADPTRSWTGHPISALERARRPIQFADLERGASAVAGVRFFYFVAVRSYPAVTRYGRPCPTETRVEGFVIGDARPVFIGSGARLEGGCSDSPGMYGLSTRPYGLLRLGGRSFLFAMEEAYEQSVPVIYEVGPAGLEEVLRGEW